MENKYKLWVARDADGEIAFFKEKPERSEYLWESKWLCCIRSEMFPGIKWEDEPLEVEIRPVITDLDAKAQEYADKVTDNEEIKELIINAFKAGYNI